MLSRTTLNQGEVIKAPDSNPIYPTLEFVSDDGKNYLTMVPGCKTNCVCVALSTTEEDEYVIYSLIAPYTNLIYYMHEAVRTLLDKTFYQNTGYTIVDVALCYHNELTGKLMYGQYSLEPTGVSDYTYVRKLEEMRLDA